MSVPFALSAAVSALVDDFQDDVLAASQIIGLVTLKDGRKAALSVTLDTDSDEVAMAEDVERAGQQHAVVDPLVLHFREALESIERMGRENPGYGFSCAGLAREALKNAPVTGAS